MRSLRILLVALGIATPTSAQPAAIAAHPEELRFAEPAFMVPPAESFRHQLATGPVVYVVEDPSLTLVDVQVALAAGSTAEPTTHAGLAFLTAALLRGAGAGDRSAELFDERADSLGLELASRASDSRAVAHLDAGSWAVDEGLDLLLDLLLRPRFAEERLANAKAQLSDSMAHRNDDPIAVAEREWAWLIDGDDAEAVMTPATLSRIERDELIAFHRRQWQPRSWVMAVSGDVDAARIVAELDRRLAERSTAGALAGQGVDEKNDAGSTAKARRAQTPAGFYHVDRQGAQSQVILGHRLPRSLSWNHPDRAGLLLLAEVLGGGGAIARIQGRLRSAEGLAYRTSTGLELGPAGSPQLRIFFATEPADVARAIVACRQELERLQSQEITLRELHIAQRELRETVRRQLSTAAGLAGTFAEDTLIGRPHTYWQDLEERVGAVTTADLRRLARGYLQPRQLIVLVVGDGRSLRRGARAVGIDLHKLADGRVTELPNRDPLTLEPRRGRRP